MTGPSALPEASSGGDSRALIKQVFKRGLAALLPTLLTLVILIKAYQFLRDSVGYRISKLLALYLQWAFGYGVAEGSWLAGVLTVLGILVAVVAVFILGYLVSTVVGRWVYGLLDSWLGRLPVTRQLYPSVKKVIEFLLSEQALRFTQVVAVPYPRQGVYSLGFVTGEGFRKLDRATGRHMVNVFMPSSPTPISGYVVFFTEDEVVYLDISVEDAFRFIVSGGVVVPGSERTIAVPPEMLPTGNRLPSDPARTYPPHPGDGKPLRPGP